MVNRQSGLDIKAKHLRPTFHRRLSAHDAATMVLFSGACCLQTGLFPRLQNSSGYLRPWPWLPHRRRRPPHQLVPTAHCPQPCSPHGQSDEAEPTASRTCPRWASGRETNALHGGHRLDIPPCAPCAPFTAESLPKSRPDCTTWCSKYCLSANSSPFPRLISYDVMIPGERGVRRNEKKKKLLHVACAGRNGMSGMVG